MDPTTTSPSANGTDREQHLIPTTIEGKDPNDIHCDIYPSLNDTVTAALKNSADKPAIFAAADMVLHALSTPNCSFLPKYWKLLFKIYEQLPDSTPIEEVDEPEHSAASPASLVSQEMIGSLAYYIAVQGCHSKSLPLWRRYLAKAATIEPNYLLEALEALSTIPISGSTLLIGEYLKSPILSSLQDDYQARKIALQEIVSAGADEDRVSQWVALPGELKTLITSYISSTPLEEEIPFRADTEVPRLQQSKESAEVYNNILTFCERAQLICRGQSTHVPIQPPSTILLHPYAYILQLGLMTALAAKRHFLARSLCLSLLRVLAEDYQEFVAAHQSSSNNADEPAVISEGPRGLLLARYLSDLRLLIDNSSLQSDPRNDDNAMLRATWIAECYGPDFGPTCAEEAAAASKMSLFEFMASCSAPSPEVVRMITWLEEVEHSADLENADDSNDVCLRMCLDECIRLYEADPSLSQTVVELYDVIVHHEASKLMRYRGDAMQTEEAQPPLEPSSEPSTHRPSEEKNQKVAQQDGKLRNLLEEMLNSEIGKFSVHLVMLGMSVFAEVLHDYTASQELGKKSLSVIEDKEQSQMLEEHMARIAQLVSDDQSLHSSDPQLVTSSGESLLKSSTSDPSSIFSLATSASSELRAPAGEGIDAQDPAKPSKKRPRPEGDENIDVPADEAEPATKVARESEAESTPTTNAASATPNIWFPRYHPPGLPQHDDTFHISANLVNALLPSQRALQELPRDDPQLDNSTEIDSLENAQKALLMRKKLTSSKANPDTASDIKLPPLVVSSLTPEQRTKLVTLLEKGELHGFVKQLKQSQLQVEAELEREKRVLEAVHAQRRLDLANRQRALMMPNMVTLHEPQLSLFQAKNREEVQQLEDALARQMSDLEAKRAKALSEKLKNQQQVLQAFGVPGFVSTTEEKSIELQRVILQLIQYEAEKNSKSEDPNITAQQGLETASQFLKKSTTTQPAPQLGPSPKHSPVGTISMLSRPTLSLRSPQKYASSYIQRPVATQQSRPPIATAAGNSSYLPPQTSRPPPQIPPGSYPPPNQSQGADATSSNRSTLQRHWDTMRAQYSQLPASHPPHPNSGTHNASNSPYPYQNAARTPYQQSSSTRSHSNHNPALSSYRASPAQIQLPTTTTATILPNQHRATYSNAPQARYGAPLAAPSPYPSSAPPSYPPPSSTPYASSNPRPYTHTPLQAQVHQPQAQAPPSYSRLGPPPPSATTAAPLSTAEVYQDLQRQLNIVEQREASQSAPRYSAPAQQHPYQYSQHSTPHTQTHQTQPQHAYHSYQQPKQLPQQQPPQYTYPTASTPAYYPPQQPKYPPPQAYSAPYPHQHQQHQQHQQAPPHHYPPQQHPPAAYPPPSYQNYRYK